MNNSKEEILDILKKLIKLQYMYEQEALEINNKTIRTEKELAKIYKNIINKEVEEFEDREDSPM